MPTTKIYVQSPNYSLRLNQPRYTMSLARGTQGPQGPPGLPGGTSVTYQAGENLSSGRVVVIDGGQAFYFQPADSTHQGRAFGVTVTSATSGNSVDIQTVGERTDAAFSFTADTPLWVDSDGEIVNTQPGSGALIQGAGVASGNKKILIDLSLNIKKN